MNYTKQMVEAFLRDYSLLQHAVAYNGDDDLMNAKIDLDRGIRKLQNTSINLHRTIIGVFVYGNPIQEQAKLMGVSKRQINRRLDDALHMLTRIMNGEVL